MRRIYVLFAALIVCSVAIAADVVFKAAAPEAVAKGEQFRLTFTVNGEGRELRVQEMPDFEVLMGPSTSQSHSTQWINGKASSETTFTFTYILLAKKEGTFNIPPATIKVDGRNYASNALIVKVLPEDKSASAAGSRQGNGSTQTSSSAIPKDALFMTMNVSKRSVYEQEGFLVTFKVYSLYNFGFKEIKYPEFDGFLVQEVELPQEKQLTLDHYKGRNYQSAVMRQVVLYPQRSGKLTIPAGRYEVVFQVRSQERVNSIFDSFFDSYQDVQKTLSTPATTIDVKNLPAGKPASFNGSVGTFTMDASISANQVKADEAVTVKVNIAGNGNVKMIKNPSVEFPNDFEIYDPKVETDLKTTTAGVQGSKTIEYMAIPRFGGDFEIPPVVFSYFDTKANAYKTLTSPAFKLHVEKGTAAPSNGNAPAVSDFSRKEAVKYLGQDIRFIKVKNIRFASYEELFYGSFLYIMAYIVPLLLFLLFFFIYRKQVKENANIALVRTKKANKMAVRRLKVAGKLLKENKKEAFYEEVLRALWGYLSDKLSIPQSDLTKDNVETELNKYGVEPDLIREFLDILDTCEFARYAPVQASDAMDKLYELTIDAIDKMENMIKK